MTQEKHQITLNNGVEMPAVGFGVYQIPPEETGRAVETALEEGYRLIDTAAAYGNEEQVGQGLRQSGLDRSEVFVTTKLWVSDFGHDEALKAFDQSIQRLGLDYIDLYLLHWPAPSDFDETVASFRAAESILSDGRTRAIGVCNFGEGHLERLLAKTDVVPTVNQVELHPYFAQPGLRDTDDRLDVVTQAWSPIGGVKRYSPGNPDEAEDPLRDDVIQSLADKHGKTPAQIILRWHLEHGTSVIPKSVHKERIAENFSIFDFRLTPGEVAAIDRLDTGERGGPDPDEVSTDFKISG